MTNRRVPDRIEGYLKTTAHLEAPEKFHLWTALSTISSVIGRRVYIEEDAYQHIPNLYVIFVAPPGIATKSTTIGIGKKYLEEVPGVIIGPSSTTFQMLMQVAVDARQDMEIAPLEFMPASPFTLHINEFGTFMQDSEGGMADTLIDLFDGKTIDRGTKKDGITHIENPALTLIAGTTPAWMLENFRGYFKDGGLGSRCIFVYAEDKRQSVAFPSDCGIKTFNPDLLEDLKAMSHLIGEMYWSSEAKDWAKAWYDKHDKFAKHHHLYTLLPGYLSRKFVYLQKVAMLKSISRSDKRVISKADILWALARIEEMEIDMQKCIGLQTLNPFMALQGIIISKLKETNKPIKQSKLYQSLMSSVNKKEFETILGSLVYAGKVEILDTLSGPAVQLYIEPPPSMETDDETRHKLPGYDR